MKNTLTSLSLVLTLLLSSCLPDDTQPSQFDEEQLARDFEIIDEFLTANDIAADKHESGIRYIIENDGIGESPIVGDRIVAKFVGSDLEGNVLVFDTLGLTDDLDQFILRSWLLMLPEIQELGKIKIYSPSGYAYGAAGNSFVDPNEIVVFDIELLGIVKDADDQQAIEETIIEEFLTESNIDFQVHQSGIRYVIVEEGTGDNPALTDVVSVGYTGTFLTGGQFDSSESVEFELGRLIRAWQLMIPEIKEGGRIKIYSPSRYCYGTTGNQGIPPNTILAFNIELKEIIN